MIFHFFSFFFFFLFFFFSLYLFLFFFFFFFFQAEDGIRDLYVTGVQTCALPIWRGSAAPAFFRCAASGSPLRPRRESPAPAQGACPRLRWGRCRARSR